MAFNPCIIPQNNINAFQANNTKKSTNTTEVNTEIHNSLQQAERHNKSFSQLKQKLNAVRDDLRKSINSVRNKINFIGNKDALEKLKYTSMGDDEEEITLQDLYKKIDAEYSNDPESLKEIKKWIKDNCGNTEYLDRKQIAKLEVKLSAIRTSKHLANMGFI
jgi:hypothetical protein